LRPASKKIDAGGNINLQYAGSDYRVSAFDSMTCGLSYDLKLSINSEFTIRGELMQQKIDSSDAPRAEKRLQI